MSYFFPQHRNYSKICLHRTNTSALISPQKIYQTQQQTTFIHRFALHHGLQPFPTHFNTLSMEHKLSSTWNHATASSSQDTYGQMQLKPTAVEKHRFMFFPRGDNNTHCSSRMPSDAGGTRDLLTWRRGIIFLSYGMVPHWHAASRPERREEHLNRNPPVNTLEK